jgi:glycosyltransferase involved in cell wall biosynthesis
MDTSLDPLVSILMTSYNREKYIAIAIESVLALNYSNFELIIVDDASKDNTVKIAQKFALLDSRIKVIVNEENLGDFSNRNKAAGLAIGKYLKYVDADDYIYPWGLRLMVEMMEKYPSAGWGLCSLEQDENRPFPFQLNPDESYEYSYLGPGLFHKSPLSSIIKKEAFLDCEGFPGKQHLGDFELWHILAGKYPVVLMPHGMVWHRVHDEQQSRDNREDPTVNFKYTVSAFHFFESEKRIPMTTEKIAIIRKKLHSRILKDIVKRLKKMDFKNAKKMYSIFKDLNFNFTLK